MADDVLLNKASIIERCVARVREEHGKDPLTFGSDFTRQDAAILNLQRACEACLDMGQHLLQRAASWATAKRPRCVHSFGPGGLD